MLRHFYEENGLSTENLKLGSRRWQLVAEALELCSDHSHGDHNNGILRSQMYMIGS